MEQNDFPGNIKRSVVRRFNLRHDQAEEEEVIDSITRNSDFIGANLWTLIFAILIASIGLNMNSTAVIIGAMLISPLMGIGLTAAAPADEKVSGRRIELVDSP